MVPTWSVRLLFISVYSFVDMVIEQTPAGRQAAVIFLTMDHFNAMRIFTRIVELGGFARAPGSGVTFSAREDDRGDGTSRGSLKVFQRR